MEAVRRHATFCGLVRKETLSAFNAAHAFIRHSHYEAMPVWSTVTAEMSTFARLVLFMVSPWDLKWNQHLSATACSKTGWGRCRPLFPASCVATVGRYLCADHDSARVAALSLEVPSAEPSHLSEDFPLGIDLVCDPPFAECCGGCLHLRSGTPVSHGSTNEPKTSSCWKLTDCRPVLGPKFEALSNESCPHSVLAV